MWIVVGTHHRRWEQRKSFVRRQKLTAFQVSNFAAFISFSSQFEAAYSDRRLEKPHAYDLHKPRPVADLKTNAFVPYLSRYRYQINKRCF